MENSSIIIGKNKQLYQLSYIKAYCQPKAQSTEELIGFADKLKKLSTFLASKKITFIYLMTPSKAEYLPSAIPARFQCKDRGLSAHVLSLEKLLHERKVLFVNGPALMKTATQEVKLPLFPEGGTHWNWLGAGITANALIAAINQKQTPALPFLKFNYTLGTPDHQDMDGDLIELIKLLKPDFSYLVPKLHFSPYPQNHPALKLSMIGGSFNENLIHLFSKNKVFSAIEFLYYFNVKRQFEEGKKDPIDFKLKDADRAVREAVLSSNVVVLEENSALTISEHGKRFYESICMSS